MDVPLPGGTLIVVIILSPILAGCLVPLDDGTRPGHVPILPREDWVWIGDHGYSEAITESLLEAIDSERLGCRPFSEYEQPREPMWVFHYLSVMYCDDRHGDAWAELLPWAQGNATADQIYASLNFTAGPVMARSLSLFDRANPGNLAGLHVLGQMQAVHVDAEARYSAGRDAFAEARNAGTFEYSEVNASKFHGIVVDILAAESTAANLLDAWRLVGPYIAAGPGCDESDGPPTFADLEAARLRWLTHRDAIENNSSVDLAFALSGSTNEYSKALDRLEAAQRLEWTPLAVRAASDLAVTNATLAAMAPDQAYEFPPGDIVFNDETRARINSTINHIVRSGIDPWAEGRVDRAIRLLSIDSEALRIHIEPEMEAIAMMEGRAVATPCGDA